MDGLIPLNSRKLVSLFILAKHIAFAFENSIYLVLKSASPCFFVTDGRRVLPMVINESPNLECQETEIYHCPLPRDLASLHRRRLQIPRSCINNLVS